jgi:hypothetical protein
MTLKFLILLVCFLSFLRVTSTPPTFENPIRTDRGMVILEV